VFAIVIEDVVGTIVVGPYDAPSFAALRVAAFTSAAARADCSITAHVVELIDPRSIGSASDLVDGVLRERREAHRGRLRLLNAVRVVAPAASRATRLDELHAETTAVAGRPGWRVDVDGVEWYSEAWLDDPAGGDAA
jgi:hypothetical protein